MNEYVLSKYNLFCTEKDSVIGLNLFNQHFFSISKEQYQLIEDHSSHIDDLQSVDPVFFSAMYKLGVIQDCDLNIPNILLMKNREEIFVQDEYHLTINTTLNCNFSCWYCFESHPQGKMTEETKVAIIEFVKKTIKEKKIKILRLNWFGGEPLITYKSVLKPLSEQINKICIENNVQLTTAITTNGYLVNQEIVDFFKQYNVGTYQITLDGDRSHHNKVRYNKREGSYDTIVKNICRIVTALPDIKMILRINYTHENVDTCTHVIDSFPVELRNKISINLIQVKQEKKFDIDTLIREQEIYSVFKNAGFSQAKHTLFPLKYFTCYAELFNQAIINYDGRVFKCSTCDFENTEEEGILTNDGIIVWNDSSRSNRLARATFDHVSCLNCPYLPICRGGCSQHQFGTNQDGCVIKPRLEYLLKKMMKRFPEFNRKLMHARQLEQLLLE